MNPLLKTTALAASLALAASAAASPLFGSPTWQARKAKQVQAVSVPAPTAAPDSRFELNGDGRIDALDTALLVGMLQPLGLDGTQPVPPGSGSSLSRLDLNQDGVLSRADWARFVGYVAHVGAHSLALLDVAGSPGLDVLDVQAMAQQVQWARSPGAAYVYRFDLNADGRVDAQDWLLFRAQLSQLKPLVLLDFNRDGVFNGRDLDLMASTLDARSFDPILDLDGDGKLSTADWRLAAQHAWQLSPKALFDVDGQSARSQPVLSQADNRQIATSLDGLGIGFAVSSRFDFNADGRVSAEDWAMWLRYATLSLKRPDLVLDVDGDGQVGPSDLVMVHASLGARPVPHGLDLNGDGRIDEQDVAVLQDRLATGPIRLIRGDVNRDGCVDEADRALVQRAWGSVPGWPLFDPDLDIDGNGLIDSTDLVWVQQNLGRCR